MNSSWDPRAWEALGVYFMRHFHWTEEVHRQLPTWELLFKFVRGEDIPLKSVFDSVGAFVRDGAGGTSSPVWGATSPPATAGRRRVSSRTVPTAGSTLRAGRGVEALPKVPAAQLFSDSLEHAQKEPPAAPAAVPPLAVSPGLPGNAIDSSCEQREPVPELLGKAPADYAGTAPCPTFSTARHGSDRSGPTLARCTGGEC
ncbi:unnamed protein product [Coccothraustes coccothraustes]